MLTSLRRLLTHDLYIQIRETEHAVTDLGTGRVWLWPVICRFRHYRRAGTLLVVAGALSHFIHNKTLGLIPASCQ